MRLGNDKHAILLAVFLLLSASAGGQARRTYKYHFLGDLQGTHVVKSDKSISINYSISELNIESIVNENGSFYRIEIPGHTPTTITGKPELPVLNRLITVPENYTYQVKFSQVKSTRVKPSGEKIGGILIPAQEGETKEVQKKKPIFSIDKTIYGTRGLISSDTVRIESLGIIRNKRLANLIISPVRYNPRTNIIEVITSMKIEISFSQPGGMISKSLLPESALFTESLDKGVLYYDQGNMIPGYSDKPVKMIILTDTTFLKHLQPLLRWKTQKGFELEVLTRGIKSAGNTYTEIKNRLSQIYNGSSENNPPPEYLLIIGDVNKVPYYGTGNVTDMYYGEFDGNGDYIPEMFIGRLPVADTTELKSVVKKIIQYEKFQFADTNKFYSDAIATAGVDAGYANFMNGQLKYAVKNYLTPLFKINEQHFNYFSLLNGTDALAAAARVSRKDSLIKAINKGTSLINYTGHGDASGWLHINLKVPDTSNLNNINRYPFIISNACRTAQYNLSSSFGNNMVLAKNKGAIGFIGCSNDSYWDEDFYWAVGTGTPSANPTYETTGLGAYDRLFHSHTESPSDWYFTMGQIIYAGNLAVSASSSPRKKYYWETYNLVGDPSMIPIIGRPDTFKINLPDTLPNGIKSLSLNIDPFAYIAVSHFDKLWDASYASPSGSVVLDMPGLSNDSCLFVITGQNKIPVIKKVYISEITNNYLNLTSTSINDNLANKNGRADFGETFYLATTISNLGSTDATGIYLKLSTSSSLPVINNDSVSIGTIPARSEITIPDGFSITLPDKVPDKGIITFNLQVKDSVSEKNYIVDINVHAPKLEIISCKIDDTLYGNKNFIADPGETVNFVFIVKNQGSSNTSGNLVVSAADEKISILQPSIKSGILQFAETTEIVVPAKISVDAAIGTTISLSSLLDCSPYISEKSFSFRVGKIRESFESSSFNIFPWINVSTVPWIVTGSGSYDGNLSARSGAITHDGSSSLIIRLNYSKPDSLKFWYKVSSEKNYDFLIFKLNGVEIFRKSGETLWEKKVIPVSVGYNKMEWIFIMDQSTLGGSNCAWIDMIDFSGSSPVSYIQKDLQVARIVTPVQIDKFGQGTVTVKVLNPGKDILNGFNLAYSVNGHYPPVKQFFENTVIPYSDSVTVSFKTKADISKLGFYEIVTYGFDNNDNYITNDTVRVNFKNTEISDSLIIFPNPFKDQFKIFINSSFEDKLQISLTNISGIKMYIIEKAIGKGKNMLIIDNIRLSPSVYYLNIRGATINKTVPMLKINK